MIERPSVDYFAYSDGEVAFLELVKKFISLKEIEKTIFLTPKLDYEIEVKKGIKNSKIKVLSLIHI